MSLNRDVCLSASLSSLCSFLKLIHVPVLLKFTVARCLKFILNTVVSMYWLSGRSTMNTIDRNGRLLGSVPVSDG